MATTPNLPNTTELQEDHRPPPYSSTPPTEPSPSKSAEALHHPISRHETEPLPPYQREPGQTTHDANSTQHAEGDQDPKKKPKWYKRGGVVAGAIEGTLLVLLFALVT